MSNVLKPMFKWTGGKRREISKFEPFFPKFVKLNENFRYVEPFVGGGAVYFYINNKNSKINDWDSELINFYEEIALNSDSIFKLVNKVSKLFKDEKDYPKRQKAYYDYRALDVKPGLEKISKTKRAARFYILTQLAFSGMRRFSAGGYFNVPFGHYKSFNASLLKSQEHISLLKTTEITCGDYKISLKGEDNANTFIFVDPPYTRVMKKYSSDSSFGDEEQKQLAKTLKSMKNASWMVVIDKSPLTEKLYKKYIVATYPVQYGVNIKNRFSQNAEHIVAVNYTV